MNKYDYIFFGFMFFWILETVFFGFNEKPINSIEKMADSISFIGMAYCFFQSGAINITKSVKVSLEFQTLERFKEEANK